MNAPFERRSWLDRLVLSSVLVMGGLAAGWTDQNFIALRQWEAKNRPQSVRPPWCVKLESSTSRAMLGLETVLCVASPGLTLIAYRPRKEILLKRRGPGHVALTIATGMLALSLVRYYLYFYGPAQLTEYIAGFTIPNQPQVWIYLSPKFGDPIACGIVAAWTYLAMIGGWRRSHMPFEQAGRWIGWTWIFCSVVSWSVGLLRDL